MAVRPDCFSICKYCITASICLTAEIIFYFPPLMNFPRIQPVFFFQNCPLFFYGLIRHGGSDGVYWQEVGITDLSTHANPCTMQCRLTKAPQHYYVYNTLIIYLLIHLFLGGLHLATPSQVISYSYAILN